MNVREIERLTFKGWEKEAVRHQKRVRGYNGVFCAVCDMLFRIEEKREHAERHRYHARSQLRRTGFLTRTRGLHGKLIIPHSATQEDGRAAEAEIRRVLGLGQYSPAFTFWALFSFVRENVKLIQGARVYLRAHGKLDDRPVCFSMNPEDVRFLHDLFVAGMQYEEIQAIYRNMAHQKQERAA